MAVHENPKFYMASEWVAMTCGVNILGRFKYLPEDEEYTEARCKMYYDSVINKIDKEGTGYVIVGYINTEVCKEAEQRIGKLYKEVFRSETRLNRNSNHMFYFVIYDATEEPNGNS